MHLKSLLVMSVSAAALLGSIPAQAQPAPGTVEYQLARLFRLCDGGDRQSCVHFGFILGGNPDSQAAWRQQYPEWWAWDAPAAAPVAGPPAAPVASITAAPPELPVYEQPPIPASGYLWTPGYWAYGSEGYYWVPGTWVQPPSAGLLWTPGYWGWRDGVYAWNAGYWGPHIGFYGGIDYGFGYTGAGYAGGRWNNGVFVYNDTVNNFGGVRITNVYSETVVVRTDVRVSFNGGDAGVKARPTPQEEAVAHEAHTPPTPEQKHQHEVASTTKALLAKENHGRPTIAATSKPGEFTGKGVVAAREAPHGTTPTGQPTTTAKTPANPTAANPSGTVPNEGKKPEKGPSEAKRSEPNPDQTKKPTTPANETTKSGSKPSETTKTETNPSGPKVHDKKATEVEHGTPNGATTPETNPSGPKAHDKKATEVEHGPPNGTTTPKITTTATKPSGTTASTPPAPPPPQRTAGPTAHSATTAHTAKPVTDPKEKKPPQ